MKNMDKRSEDIFSSLISSFIEAGRPVGSATIAENLERRFSPALIRNVMADLEETGLLTHRHTSGGRVPTDEGMRYYVDRLLKIETLSEEVLEKIRKSYKSTSFNVTDICKETSKILSKLSTYAGLIASPTLKEAVIKKIEFIQLSRNRLLGIFVGRNGLVQNKLIETEKHLTYPEIEKINNYCNKVFYGMTITQARKRIKKEIDEVRWEMEGLMSRALRLSDEMFLDIGRDDVYVEGEAQLFSIPDFMDMQRVREITELLEEKTELLGILNHVAESENVSIFIGSESGYSSVSDCSLVLSRYRKDGEVVGTLGVIGPTRMNYASVIPIVDCTAKLVSKCLDGEC